MSNEQGFVAVPNWVFDKVMPMLCAHKMQKLWAAYSLILRKTHGFNKASDAIPAKQFEGVGIKDEKTLTSTINELVDLGLVTVIRQNGRTNIYSFISLDTENHHDSTTTVKPPRFNPTTPIQSTTPPRMNQGATTPNESGASKDNTKNNTQQTNSLGDKPQKQTVQRTAKPTPNDEKAKSYTVQDLVDLGCNAQCAKDWLAIRTKKLTESALNRNISQASKVGLTLAEAVAWCAENAWQGFTASWYLNATKQPIATFSQKPASRSDGWDELFSQGDSDIRDVTPPKKYYQIEGANHA